MSVFWLFYLVLVAFPVGVCGLLRSSLVVCFLAVLLGGSGGFFCWCSWFASGVWLSVFWLFHLVLVSFPVGVCGLLRSSLVVCFLAVLLGGSGGFFCWCSWFASGVWLSVFWLFHLVLVSFPVGVCGLLEAAWLSVFWLFYLGVLEVFSVGVHGLLLGFGCLSFGFCLLLFGFVVLLFAFAADMVHRKIASPGSATKRAIPKMEATICVSANKQPKLPQLCCAVILHRALVLRNRFGRNQPKNKAPEKKYTHI